jgi:hypothetical protein
MGLQNPPHNPINSTCLNVRKAVRISALIHKGKFNVSYSVCIVVLGDLNFRQLSSFYEDK